MPYSRARSTKTRIETNNGDYTNGGVTAHSRARSTKTRIETNKYHLKSFAFNYSRARSTKTRIETNLYYVFMHMRCIREQDPLKQGLKLEGGTDKDKIKLIREQDPLKQGLKQIWNCCVQDPGTDSRARSTKTRIETQRYILYYWNAFYSRARSTKTRIETPWRINIEYG